MARTPGFLSRSFLDLPPDGDDGAIVGRGPNIPLRDRVRLRRPVGRSRPNEPDDVATLETMLRQSGDFSFRTGSEPTGLFSVGMDQATRRFQRRRGLFDDGIVEPDGETFDALEDEVFVGDGADERRDEARCAQLRVHLANLEMDIDQATSELEAADAALVALSEEAESLNAEHELRLKIMAITMLVPGMAAIRAGRGIIAALREFASGSDLPGLLEVQAEAGDIADRFDDAIYEFELRLENLQRLQEEERQLRQELEALGCG